MKYTTNNQNEFENLATLHLSAFNKWVNQKSNLFDNVDMNMKGRQKISSMICFKIVVLMFYEFHEFVILFI
jgi:hypothetical protein